MLGPLLAAIEWDAPLRAMWGIKPGDRACNFIL